MADVSTDTMNRLWYETRGYSWESARQGLDAIYRRDIITSRMYQDMLWAINKLENLGSEFPLSSSELYSKMSYYM